MKSESFTTLTLRPEKQRNFSGIRKLYLKNAKEEYDEYNKFKKLFEEFFPNNKKNKSHSKIHFDKTKLFKRINKNHKTSRNSPRFSYNKEILDSNRTMKNKSNISSDKNTVSENVIKKHMNKKNRSLFNFIYNNLKALKDNTYLNNSKPYNSYWINKFILKSYKENSDKYILPFNNEVKNQNDIFYKTMTKKRNKNIVYQNPIKKNINKAYTKRANIQFFNNEPLLQRKQNTVEFPMLKNSNSMINLININHINFYNNKKEEKYQDSIKNNHIIINNKNKKHYSLIEKEKEKDKKVFEIKNNLIRKSREIIELPEYLEEDA